MMGSDLAVIVDGAYNVDAFKSGSRTTAAFEPVPAGTSHGPASLAGSGLFTCEF